MKDDAVYLQHILECIARIEENTLTGHDQFMASHTLQDAVMRNLQTLAESTQRFIFFLVRRKTYEKLPEILFALSRV